jgi:hypothetical protein
MSPALKSSLFVSVALAAFAGQAQAGGYKRLHLDSPLVGSAYDELSGYAADADIADISDINSISRAAKAAVRMLEDEDVVEELLGDLAE